MLFEFLALAAACCWAIASLFSATAARHLGAFAFSRWRMACVSVMLWSVSLISGGWHSLNMDGASVMALSGVIGIFIGDTALFAAMNTLGPRRAVVLFASHSVFSVVLGYLILGETLQGLTLVGCALVASGVMGAVFFGRREGETHHWEADNGKLAVGIGLGLMSALCQASATLMVKPVMQGDIDAVSASAVRMTTALTLHLLFLFSGARLAKAVKPISWPVLAQVAANAFLSMGVGMTLILYALRYGEVGLVAMLSSVSPVLILPLLWLVQKKPPAKGAWLGALVTVLGAMLIVSRST
ncbi:DMT family transporter [Gallaecimonas mangrovi]|uniref:DMT family transporter n=1 Tax=Gallaecimonas mangrovi TaxID=2291597 RepID=UPI000E20960C|nr:DMT family transporter [Gallaecimonas mangrovi]